MMTINEFEAMALELSGVRPADGQQNSALVAGCCFGLAGARQRYLYQAASDQRGMSARHAMS